MFSVLLLSLALALDAFCVSFIEGAITKKRSIILALKLAFTFGIFQAVLAFFGALLGKAIEPLFKEIKIEALGGTLLVMIGVQTLMEHLF